MKALSVQQPYASGIACGAKTIEIRTWKTNYRGPLLICASARPKIDLDGFGPLPTGQAVGLVDLVDVQPFTAKHRRGACIPKDEELPEGLYAWVLANSRNVKPFPVKGKLNIFDVKDKITLL